ncbi:MAG: hypothetical protein IJH55_04955, partial [Romboutsia sp.]|nr:hypothetical protein [Romboutsia sp.]
MAKKRKLKKSVLIGITIVAFFIVYGISFYHFTSSDDKDKTEVEVSEETKEDTRDLMTQLKNKKKIYMSSGDIKNIKVESIYWDEIKYELTKLSKVRNQEKFTPTYTGYS